MLDNICPLQFIEGLNEGEEANRSSFFDICNYPITAIEYKPKISYCLTDLEILISVDVRNSEEFRVVLYPDYASKPNDVILTEGILSTKPRKEITQQGIVVTADWQKVIFEQAFVVIPHNTYWIAILSERHSLRLVSAIDGRFTKILVHSNQEWKNDKCSQDWKCMIRFYGRMLPFPNVSSNSGSEKN